MRFLFAWELGGGLGHTVPLSQIARPLLQAGHRVEFVLRDLSTARSALGDLYGHPNASLWQAPVWHAQFLATRHPVAYSELLFAAGYLDANRLLGVVLGWQSLFKAIDPDLLLVDHAPTALLAARGFAFPRAMCGNGYFVPPHRVPIPNFAEWEAPDAQRLALTERLALDTCNAILRELKLAPLTALHEIYSVDQEFLLTWPELDHYSHAARDPETHYWGGISAPPGGAPPEWPEGDGHRLFVYLKVEYDKTIAILEQLARGPWRTYAYVSGLPAANATKLESPFLKFATRIASLDQVAQSADALLCHGNFATVCQMLFAGVPAILLPTQAEQLLGSLRVAQNGAGIVLLEGRAVEELPSTLHRFATEDVFRNAARAFSERRGSRSDHPLDDVAAKVAGRCEALALSFPRSVCPPEPESIVP